MARPLDSSAMSGMKSSNRYSESCGPGAASGWYCTQNAGSRRCRNPSSVWSFRLKCVSSMSAGFSDSGSTANP